MLEHTRITSCSARALKGFTSPGDFIANAIAAWGGSTRGIDACFAIGHTSCKPLTTCSAKHLLAYRQQTKALP